MMKYLTQPSFTWDSWKKFNENDNVFDFKETKKVISEYMKYKLLNNNEKRHLFDVYKLSTPKSRIEMEIKCNFPLFTTGLTMLFLSPIG